MLYRPLSTPSAEQGDELDIQEFGRAILRQWPLIASIACIPTLLALCFVLFSTPQFAVNGLLYLDDGPTVANTADQTDFLSDYQIVSSVNTQLQLIQSPALLEQAILETGLNAPIVPLKQPMLPYWKWRFLYNRSIDAFAPGPNGLVAQFAMFGDPAATGAEFEVRFDKAGHYHLMTPGSFFTAPVFIATGQLGQTLSTGGLSMEINSAAGVIAPPAGSTYRLVVIPAKIMAEDVADRLSVTAAGPEIAPTNVAYVKFLWNDPYQATSFVDYLMRDFIQGQLAWKTEAASNTETYISQQLQKISTALAQANGSQASYQSQTGIVDVTTNSQAVSNQLTAYQTQRSTLLLEQEAMQQLVLSVSKKDGDINPYLISQVNDPVLAALSTTLATAEVKLQSQEAEFTGRSTEVREQVATIDRIESAIKALLQNDEAIAVKNLANIDTMITQYQAELKAIPAESLQVDQLSRATDVLGTLYGLLMQKEEEAEVSKAATVENTRIVSAAELPLTASTPRPTITVLAAFLLGLIVAVGVVMVRRAFSSSFLSDSEIRRELTEPVYGIIPRVNRKTGKRDRFTSASAEIFTESFRFLRYNLIEFPCAHKSRVVLVASASASDGKTMIATNVATFLADDHKRVLLIDADFHNGSISELLKIPATPGLSEWLMNGERPPLLAVPNQKFYVLAAGAYPKDPNELFDASRLDLIFTTLRVEFDFVIIDTPDLPAFSETLALAQQADIILSVVRIGHTSRGAFGTHCEMIESLKVQNGIIINCVDPSSHAFGSRGSGHHMRRASQQTWSSPVAYPVYETAAARARSDRDSQKLEEDPPF